VVLHVEEVGGLEVPGELVVVGVERVGLDVDADREFGEVAVGDGGGAGELLEPAFVLAVGLLAGERELGVVAVECVLDVGGRGGRGEQDGNAEGDQGTGHASAPPSDGMTKTPDERRRPLDRRDVRGRWKCTQLPARGRGLTDEISVPQRTEIRRQKAATDEHREHGFRQRTELNSIFLVA
jgi:hypothetical protein